jgi:copper chaperone CopZ
MKLIINGMNCKHCEGKVKSTLQDNGIKDIEINLETKEVVASNELSTTKVVELIEALGFDVEKIA